jgi:hypothetical protein
LKRDVLMQKRYKNARRLTRPRPGGFHPSEKYESQLFTLFPIYGKIKFMFQTPNHQPDKVNHIILIPSNYMVSFHTRSIAVENYPRVKP